MKKTIYVPDIECDSCSNLISRKFKKTEGITRLKFDEESVTIDYDEEKVSEKLLISTIKDAGFRASTQPFERKTFKERRRDYKENKHKYELERKVFKYGIGIFFLLTIIELIAYFTFLNNIPNFIGNYAWWLFYLNISIATIGVGMWHVLAYKAKVTCMTGMMIGMTVGMQTGMLLGAVIGATNGFFTGAMVGMLLGTAVGALTGKCCGVMGIMEGMMAGVMGGTMGAMITVMMLSDNILIFMPFYVAINIAIVWGLSWMMYEEVVENKRGVIKKPMDFTTLTAISIIATFILIAIMLYGPKSFLVSF